MHHAKALRAPLAKQIRKLREERHYTQDDMSEILRMSTRGFSNLERGLSGVSITTFVRFVHMLPEAEQILILREMFDILEQCENEEDFTQPGDRSDDKRASQ